MTMPNLIAKWQMKAFETAFKKEYSVIQNTIDFISVDESLNACYAYIERNETNSWYVSITDDCSVMKNALISRLKLHKVENDFYKLYAKKDMVLANGGKTINNGVTYDYWVSVSDAYLFPDGAVILMISPENTSSNSFSDAVFVIDINGKKGPNKWGYDAFYMVLTAKNTAKNIRLTDEMASLVEKGGKLPRTILQNKNENTDFSWDW